MAEKKLTVKQAKFVKEYVKNDGNGTKAALKAYDAKDETVASSIATENLRKPYIMDELLKAARRQGITEEKIIQPVVDALNDEQLDMRLKGHDRIVKLINGKENGLQLNIENAQGIEITFKDMGVNNAQHQGSTPGDITQNA